jgi:glycosyltransferase involved in cell wall biosynthesis
MPGELIRVLMIGHPDPDFHQSVRLENIPATWADGFSISRVDTDRGLSLVLAQFRPQVIVSFGSLAALKELQAASLDIRQRWIHFEDPSVEPHVLASRIMHCYVNFATRNRFPMEPLVSVFTPAYQSGERIKRLYHSLLAQTYRNWEWVVYDDSPDENTFALLKELCREDPRISLFRSDQNCGDIGEVKRRCCGLARGSILAEADHDDELTNHCLADVVEAFNTFPDAGFAYTDCAEVFEDGRNARYGDTFAYGFGSYRTEIYRGRSYEVTNYPSINSKTVRNIVSMPNHIRAWRREAYNEAGGYGSAIHIADDYELCVRTFLTTRMVHVQRFGYIQYLGTSNENTQRTRNKEIQRLVAWFLQRYEDEIHQRFLQLGVDDFIRKDGKCDWNIANPEPTPVANYILK